MTIRCLFWNVKLRNAKDAEARSAPVACAVAAMAAEHGANLLALCEVSGVSAPTLTNELGSAMPGWQRAEEARAITLATGVTVLHGPGLKAPPHIQSGAPGSRHVVARWTGEDALTLVVAHLASRVSLPSEVARFESAQRFRRALSVIEADSGHGATVLCGDLNLDPYEAGAVGRGTLNAKMTLREAREDADAAFYNPMWGLFGDRTAGPPASFHWAPPSDTSTPPWRMLDQLLVRPSVLSHWHLDDVRVLDRAGTDSLPTDSGVPDAKQYSDHLPLFFALNRRGSAHVS